MTDEERRRSGISDGRVLGWLSGLGIVAIPWMASGVIATFTPEPESSFPWILGVTFVVMVVWIVYGVVRIPRFRRGALIGAAIALGVIALLYGLVAVAAGR